MVAIPTTPDRPQPVIYNLATDYARYGLTVAEAGEVINNRFLNRNGYGRPEFIVLHIQDGSTPGSLDWWAKVQASSTVMIQKDGSILQVIPEKHGPWTNGDDINPTPEANEILALGGNPNNWSLTGEFEGDPAHPLTEAQFNAGLWWVEDCLIRYPNILEHTWSILRHRFINSRDRWNCPDWDSDPTVQGFVFDRVVAGVNTWLATAVVPPKDVETPEAELPDPFPPGMTEELARRLYGTATVPWSSKTFGFDLTRSECRYWLERGKLQIPEGGTWSDADWPELDDIIRREDGRVHVYRWNNGDVYEKIIR